MGKIIISVFQSICIPGGYSQFQVDVGQVGTSEFETKKRTDIASIRADYFNAERDKQSLDILQLNQEWKSSAHFRCIVQISGILLLPFQNKIHDVHRGDVQRSNGRSVALVSCVHGTANEDH
ncbi:unnamed protein product [Allacma fusca]|uniref:Uncharacterized protein n=1 Tax=Allacma fusca TaxID=39272 RepID=A0A8J2P180_9HEXA|nr:unnamed protein product [Allacma fusca]